ncbi:hypothetical protein [Halorubrum sp. BV1]|uniref:hypothetical protein n=1 Tax=Halorubrum sp. BV1 TaxID=1498500 RepID=UPI000679D9AE|nr:hypothetical protein [Halorubrum sp. BV1]
MPEVVQRDAERTVEVAGHTCRQVAVDTGTSVLAKYECVDCGVHTNSILTLDYLDCETGESDRPDDISDDPEPHWPDLRVHRDLDAILEDLREKEAVVEVEPSLSNPKTGAVASLFVEIGGSRPSSLDVSPVLRDHDLIISHSYLSPRDGLRLQIVCPEVSRFAA